MRHSKIHIHFRFDRPSLAAVLVFVLGFLGGFIDTVFIVQCLESNRMFLDLSMFDGKLSQIALVHKKSANSLSHAWDSL
jgi:hypothetical protein